MRILILGGTEQARDLADHLQAHPDLTVTMSLAGRTQDPLPYAAPSRKGGFGGVDGLVAYLREAKIDLLIDATHPFATVISRNAAMAAARTGITAWRLSRPEWQREAGDQWITADDHGSAITALGTKPARVLLAIGRQEVWRYQCAPQHFYLIRSIEPVDENALPPHAEVILARGPFLALDEQALLEAYKIETIVTKNSGGKASYGKIEAARALSVPVIIIRQPESTDIAEVLSVRDVLARLES